MTPTAVAASLRQIRDAFVQLAKAVGAAVRALTAWLRPLLLDAGRRGSRAAAAGARRVAGLMRTRRRRAARRLRKASRR